MDCFVNLGQFRHSRQRKKKMLETSRETSERIYACFKAATETPGKQLGSTGSWLLLLRGEPDLEPPQPRTSWTGSKRERCVQRLSPPSPRVHGAIPAHSSLAHTWLRVRKDIHLLTKGEKKKKKGNIKTSCKCSYSTGWNRAFLSYQLFEEKQRCFPFH